MALQKAATHPSRNTKDFNTYFGCLACAADDDAKSVRAKTHATTPNKAPKYVEVPFHPDLQYTDKVARALQEGTGLHISCDKVFQAHNSNGAGPDELSELRLSCVDDDNQDIVLITKPPRGTRMHFV